MRNIWEKLQNIEPRILYTLLLVFIAVPLLLGTTIPGVPSAPAQQGYNAIQAVAANRPNSLILIASDWSASTRGENHWQDLAALRQIMRDRMHFAVLSGDPQNRALTQADIATINNELTEAGQQPYVYGRDYCLWGYKPSTAMPQFLKGMVTDVPGTVKEDYKGNPVSSLGCMQGVHNVNDIGAIVLITPTSFLDTFLQFVVTKGNPPLVYFPTSVMAPEGYPYLDSHQIAGMITGVKGAGDYEALEHVKGFGLKISTALSLVYLLILILILLGNTGYYVQRAINRRAQQEGSQ
jgi:hypothetical protein